MGFKGPRVQGVKGSDPGTLEPWNPRSLSLAALAANPELRAFRPSRSLGQSFLVSARIADALVAGLDIEPGDTVLEIGPGKGVLTRRLVEQAQRVVAVEIDRRLVQRLKEELGARPNLELVQQDFLTYRMEPERPVKVIGNLPYSVSSQILFRLLDLRHHWVRAVLTTQREFAQRVLGSPGTKHYAPLSVFFERVCVREKLFNIPAASFRPRPAIVSTAFCLRVREEPLFEVANEAFFRTVVKACFSQRRKTLLNSLASGLGGDKMRVRRLIEAAGVEPAVRAEKLRPDDFGRLASVFARLQAGPG